MKKITILALLLLIGCNKEEINPSIPKEPEPKTPIEKANRMVRLSEEGKLIATDDCVRAAYQYQHLYTNLIITYKLGQDPTRIIEAMKPLEKTLIICSYE